MTWLKNNPVALVLLAGISIFLFHLNVIPVTIMEARNFITAREMITDGNWLLTTMNDLPRYEKPPYQVGLQPSLDLFLVWKM